MAQLRDAWPEIRERGTGVVVVGNGSPEQASAFKKKLRVPFPLLVDPELKSHRAADLVRSLGSTVNPRVLIHGARALAKGFLQGRTKGDATQQGGVFVIAPGDEVLFAYRSKRAGDHPKLDAVLTVLRSHKPARSSGRSG